MEVNILKRIAAYWDKRSPDFSQVRLRELNGPDAKAWLDLIQSHLPPGRDIKILDAGTGAGFFAAILTEAGYRVTGIDLSEGMLKEAEKNLRRQGLAAEFLPMSAQELKFPDQSFNAVVSRNLTWTLPDVMAAYREWRRVLKPGGVILNFDSDWGCVTFSNRAGVHAKIDAKLIDECNAIKDALRITTHRRPVWDKLFLESLGLTVTLEADVGPKVRLDKAMDYDQTPLFGIYAID